MKISRIDTILEGATRVLTQQPKKHVYPSDPQATNPYLKYYTCMVANYAIYKHFYTSYP